MYWQRPGYTRRLTAGYRLLAAETLAGPQVGIRIEATVLLFCDLNTRDCAQLPSMLCWGVVCWMLTRRYSREAKEAAAAERWGLERSRWARHRRDH